MNKRRRYKAKRRRYERKHPPLPQLMFARDAFDQVMRPFRIITVYGTGRIR